MTHLSFLQIMTALLVGGCCFAAGPAVASFHLMQIEQVIGGVNGDTSAQAIQLRMRSAFQNQVQQSKILARDATGLNPVQLIDIASSVSNFSAGSRILITTPSFASYTDVPLVSDFTMSPIPTSYLAAGQITFEGDLGGNYWGLSFGGSSYIGPNTGLTTNDADGNFGPPYGGPLPTTSTSALLFQGLASALSTTNAADYAVTAGEAMFTNNAGTQFTVQLLEDSANFDEDMDVDGNDFLIWQRGFGALGGLNQGDANNNGIVNAADLLVWKNQFGGVVSGIVAFSAVPEPSALLQIAIAISVVVVSRDRCHSRRLQRQLQRSSQRTDLETT